MVLGESRVDTLRGREIYGCDRGLRQGDSPGILADVPHCRLLRVTRWVGGGQGGGGQRAPPSARFLGGETPIARVPPGRRRTYPGRHAQGRPAGVSVIRNVAACGRFCCRSRLLE